MKKESESQYRDMPKQNLQNWEQELYNLVQSFTRAMVFGIALIYTMETWWVSTYLEFWKILLFFFLALLINLYLIPTTAQSKKYTFRKVVREGVRNKGMALLATFIVLYVLGLIDPFTPPFEKDITLIVLLSIPTGIGADVAHILNIFSQEQSSDDSKTGHEKNRHPWKFILNDIASTSGGALFVCLPIAPTFEVATITNRIFFFHRIGIIILSLVLSYVIVFSSGITTHPPSGKNSAGAKIWPFADALLSYVVALVVALMVLALFGRIALNTPVKNALQLLIVLGLPAVVGGAAGKLAI